MRHQYATLRTEIEAARLLVYNAARLKDASTQDADVQFVMEAAMVSTRI